MKKFIISFLTTVFCFSSHASFSDEWRCEESLWKEQRFYAEVFGGASFIQQSKSGGFTTRSETGYIVAGSLGYRWCYGLRLEAEYAYRRNSLKNIHFFGRTYSINGQFQTSSYMANLLWDLPLCQWGCYLWEIEPYVGVGIGYDNQRAHGKRGFLTLSGKKKGFAWQAMAGVSYPIFCNTHLSVEYKFHKGPLNHIYIHAVGVGLTYDFDFISRRP